MDKKNRAYRAKELLPGVYVITGEGVCRYLLVGRTQALLFDSGYGISNLHSFVRTITKLPLEVVISHGHLDHAGGLYNFDCPVYMHSADISVYQAH